MRGMRKGFTLIELIFVLAIIGILVAIATPRYLAYVNDAHVTTMKADAKILEDQLNIAYADSIANGNLASTATAQDKYQILEASVAGDLDSKVATGVENTPETKAIVGASTDYEAYKFDDAKIKEIGLRLKNKPEDYRALVKKDDNGLVVVHNRLLQNSKKVFFFTNVQKTGVTADGAVVTP